MNSLMYSSAVMTLSQTTEFMRNKSIDNIIIHLIVIQGLKEFTVQEVFDGIYSELPIRIEEIEKSLNRSLKNEIIELKFLDKSNLRRNKFIVSEKVLKKIDQNYTQLNDFIEKSVLELFKGFCEEKTIDKYKNLLLETVSNLMAKYGYAYAGQLAGIVDATEFIPSKELRQICESVIKKYKVEIPPKELSNAISNLFDRKDPSLTNLAFSICNRYYQSRLIGLDLPIDFLTENIYKNSIIYLDTNFIGRIALSKSKSHNEFREILRNADKLGIKFAASELTIAELHARVQNYMPELEVAEDLIPEDLIEEVRDNIIESGDMVYEKKDFDISNSENAKRLTEMGVDIIPFKHNGELFNDEELKLIIDELSEFDRKFRSSSKPKDDRALYHDAYHYFLIDKERERNHNSSAWFMSMDNSVIEHAIVKKGAKNPPYAIRLLSLLQTLSQFVESQALKGEFSDLFGELISKDLLPREQLLNYEDLKLLIGFDIKSKDIPPEFIRKATHHIKSNILKGGGITEENRALVVQEYMKFLSTPESNFIELQRKFDKKLRDKDEDLELKEDEIKKLKDQIQQKDTELDLMRIGAGKLKANIIFVIVILMVVALSLLLWLNNFKFYSDLLSMFNKPIFFNVTIQLFIISTALTILFYEKKTWIIITGALLSISSILISLA